MKRVVGIGGLFFKTTDPAATKEWYARHLGFNTDAYGATFTVNDGENPGKTGYIQWSPFKNDTGYFAPSTKDFMFNYRVADLEALVPVLKAEGVTICDEIEVYEYGKFVHILDNDGNKIELWEPID
jgi:catechol 2,3-dioxygenase-like lactoylglutathione lyase family enzyme